MTDTVITVQGRFSAWYPPERATLSLAVSCDGASRDDVFSSANSSAELIRARVSRTVDRTAGPVTSWSNDSLQVWAERPGNARGDLLPPVFHAAISFTVRFSDFSELAAVAEELAMLPHVVIGGVDWALTESTRSAVLAEVRSRAVKDAVAKASVYAQSIGLGTVRAIAIADEGMLGDLGSTSGGRAADPMQMMSARAGGTALTFSPADLQVEAVIDARFIAT